MVLKFLLILASLLQVEVGNQVLEQAEEYISNIELGQEIEYNYWSLAEIYFENCEHIPLRRLISSANVTIIKQEFSKFDCTRDSPNSKNDQLLAFAIDQEIPSLVSILLIGTSDEQLKKLGIDYLSNTLAKLTSDDIEFTFYSALVNNELVSYQEIPEAIRDLVLYSILYNYSAELYLENSIDQSFITNYQTDLLADQDQLNASFTFRLSNLIFMQFNASTYGSFLSLHYYVMNDQYFPKTLERIRHLKAMAYGFYATGRYDKALEIHRNIIQPLSLYYNNKAEVDDSKLTQATSLFSLGKFHEAKTILEDLYADEDTQVDRASLFNNLSLCYLRLGEKNKYVSYLLSALDEASSSENYANNLTILSNLFFYYTSIGDKSTALNYLALAEEIATKNDDKYQLANLHAFTGIYYWKNENDIERALVELTAASGEFDPDADFFDYFRINIDISEIYIELDSVDLAKKTLVALNTVATQASNRNAFIESTIGLLEISLIENDLASAKYYQEIIELYSLDDLSFQTLIKFNILLADFQFQSGERRRAYQNLKPVVDQVLERARTSIDTQTGYWVQQTEYIDSFNALLNILISMGYDLEAIQLLDEIKTINDAALYNSPILRANRLSEEELARDQLLNSQIMNLRESFLYAVDSDSRLRIKNEIDQLSAEREEILNKIRQNEIIKKTPAWLIQKSLTKDEKIVHFTEVGDFLYVSYITQNSVSINKLKFESSEKALFSNVADQIALSKTNLSDLYEIYDFLGLNSHLGESYSLIIIPDNYLFRIPLEILPVSKPESQTSYGSTKYLIENYHLEYFTSLQEYQSITRKYSGKYETELSAFAISDFSNFNDQRLATLPFAAQEVRSISDKLEVFSEKNLYLESAATKNAFMVEVSNAKIVHIATHSEVSEQDPLFSTIYLNDSSSENNIDALYAYELFEQRLNNELIVLNSCSSGSGDYLQGSGIMGITRALRYAGANSMALNLWAVNDKVAFEFASVFYESLNHGSSKSEAMRDAKLFLLQNGNANPHFWGAFMLTGDPSPIINKPDNAGLSFTILLLIIAGISLYVRRMHPI